VLAKLREYAPNEVSLAEILDLRIANYRARLSELRDQGFDIRNRTETQPDGTRFSWYKLVPPKPFVPADWQLLLHDFLANQWQPELFACKETEDVKL
jgi:hypothetical protein